MKLQIFTSILHSLWQATKAPEDAKGVPAMAASLFSEAGGVADILQRQLALFKPEMPVHGAQRLLGSGNEILVIPLACTSHTAAHKLKSVSDASIALLIRRLCCIHTQTNAEMPIWLTKYGMQPSSCSCRVRASERIVWHEAAALRAVAG